MPYRLPQNLIIAVVALIVGFLFVEPKPGFAEEQQKLPAQAYGGLALEIHLGTAVTATNSEYAFFMGGSTMSGGLAIGYKHDRVIYDLSFDILSIKDYATSFLIKPGLRIALYRATESKIEIFGQFDFGLGAISFKNDSESSNDSVTLFAYDIGPGIRYWVHPQLYVGASAGLAGEASDGTETNVLGIFAQGQFTGIF